MKILKNKILFQSDGKLIYDELIYAHFYFRKDEDKKLPLDQNKNKAKDLKLNARPSEANSILKPIKSPVADKKPTGNRFF